MEMMTSENLSNETTMPLVRSDQMKLLPLYMTLTVFIISLNIVVFWGFYNSKKKTFSNCLFLSIAASDLIAGLVQAPMTTIGLVYVYWPLGQLMCHVNFLMNGINYMVSDICLLILSIHRFWQITKPYSEKETMNNTKTVILASPWILAFGYNIATVIGHYYTDQLDMISCKIDKSIMFSLFQSIFVYLVPLTVTILVNILNIYHLLKKQQAMRSMSIDSKSVRTPSAPKLSLASSRPSAASLQPTDPKPSVVNLVSPRRYSRNKKALFCIIALIVNVLVTQYTSLIFSIYMLFYESVYQWLIETFVTTVELFPIGNTIIVFLFHHSFRKDLLDSFKKSRARKRLSTFF